MPENKENLFDEISNVDDYAIDESAEETLEENLSPDSNEAAFLPGWPPYPSKDCCNYVIGNSTDFDVDKDDCEVKVKDIKVKKEENKVRIRGQVVSCDIPYKGVSHVLVNLLKKEGYGLFSYFKGVAHTVTDCNGNYLFDVEKPSGILNFKDEYKIIVGKAAITTKEEDKGNKDGDSSGSFNMDRSFNTCRS